MPRSNFDPGRIDPLNRQPKAHRTQELPPIRSSGVTPLQRDHPPPKAAAKRNEAENSAAKARSKHQGILRKELMQAPNDLQFSTWPQENRRTQTLEHPVAESPALEAPEKIVNCKEGNGPPPQKQAEQLASAATNLSDNAWKNQRGMQPTGHASHTPQLKQTQT
ncbi:unnamed protein product [Calypogeia fissa]